ncbi:unnamed protein product [Rotaria sp. Silwood1]|nr:unnamed protein product [Rotaria sp. Silwood1]
MNIGVLGCANIAMRSVIPAIKSITDFKLIAVASRAKEKAAEYAEKFQCEAIEGYDNLIERKDIDALYIPLPTGLHLEYVIKALESGKHVIAEKSLGMNYTEVETMDFLKGKKVKMLDVGCGTGSFLKHIHKIDPSMDLTGMDFVSNESPGIKFIAADFLTWDVPEKYNAITNFMGIKLSKNFGQQHALAAGMEHAKGDWIVIMDCDLQDRPEEIPNLYNKALQGFDIVLASRSPFTKITSAESIATSVPVPIAIPTSAFANAGASFIPSPIIATFPEFA